jgi:WD40 repeat protein
MTAADVADAIENAASPQAAVGELVGERQLWWRACSEAVRADPPWLLGAGADLVDWLDATAPVPAGALTPARHVFLLARALCAAEGHVAEHDDDLIKLRHAWAGSGLLSGGAASGPVLPSGRGMRTVPADVTERLNAVVERLSQLHAEDGDGVLVVAALLLAGAQTRERPLVRVPVVFGGAADDDGHEPGATGVLELREFPAGPPGLHPDPRWMTGFRSEGGQFATALGRAWNLAGPRRGLRCVLWRLVLTDAPVPSPPIEGPSLGAAFALGIRDLLRHPPTRRPSVAWVRGIFHGLRPRTAVTGALGNGERLVEVSAMEAKLLAARRKGLLLVAPAANRSGLAHAPEPGDVRFAETLREADRYARRYRTGRLMIALALVAAAVTSGVVVQQREATARERLATAHELAEVSSDLLQSDVGLAGLFAEQAYRHHPDPLTRRALFQAVTAGQHLAGGVRASGTVSSMVSSANGRAVVAGTQDGVVEQWTRDGTTFRRHTRLGRLPGAVTSVATDEKGQTVIATDGTTVRVWEDGEPAAAPDLPDGQKPTTVAVSPTARYLAVATGNPKFQQPGTLAVLDLSGETRRVVLEGLTSDPTDIAFPDDLDVVVLEAGYGSWRRFSLLTLTRTSGSTIGFGNQNFAWALAPDGGHITYSNKAATLPVWQAVGTPDIDNPPLQAEVVPGGPTALALSSGGTRVAAAVDNTIHVAQTAPPGQPVPELVAMPGSGTVNELAFVGDSDSTLISASQDVISLWDIDQYSRIATSTTMPIPFSCMACEAPRVAVSPDGRDVAVIDGNTTQVSIQKTGLPAGDPRQRPMPRTLRVPGFAELLWWPDSSRLLVVGTDGSAEILTRGREWRPAGSWPAVSGLDDPSDPPAALRFLPGGEKVIELASSGALRIRNAETGDVLRQVPRPQSMAPMVETTSPRSRTHLALDERGAHAAIYDVSAWFSKKPPWVYVVDTATGAAHTIRVPDVTGLAYAGDRLLVQRRNGTLELWTASGDRRLTTTAGTPNPAFGPVVGRDLVAGTTVDARTLRLFDLPSETALGILALPPGNKSMATGMTFTADGKRLITATEAPPAATETETTAPEHDLGQLIEWRLDPDAWTRAVCASTGRDLDPAEWERHMGIPPPSTPHCGK